MLEDVKIRQMYHEITVKEAKEKEDTWFQRLHDTIRAAVEEGTLAALQRHDKYLDSNQEPTH